MTRESASHPQATVALAALALSIATFALALPGLMDVGLYYDEAFLAQQARGFVEPTRAGVHPPSIDEIEIAGRPFPLRNAAYLGSLKSQLLIPAFAVFGADAVTLRLATLSVALLALWLTMAWATTVVGTPAAVLGGLLVATDPSFYFFGQFEWGPSTTNLLCRMAGLLALTQGWRHRSTTLSVVGGLVLGLGVYSRVDFAIVVVALALGLLASRPELVREAFGQRRRATLALAAAAFVGALPMLIAIPEILETSSGIAQRGGLLEKARVSWSVLDGSHFGRLMAVGGRFESMWEASAAWTLGGFALAATATATAIAGVRGRLRHRSGIVFLAVVTSLLAIGMPWVPGAVRAHHMLNIMPFHWLWIAAVLVALGRRRGGFARPVAAALAVLLLMTNLHALLATRSELARSGGSGRFSPALFALAQQVDEPGTHVVSLDWGFHEPVLFLTDEAQALEPIWTIPRALRAGGVWRYEGSESTVYLVHDRELDLFGIGPELLRTAQRHVPGPASIDWYGDGKDFAAIRFSGPHVLLYDGTFRVRFVEPDRAAEPLGGAPPAPRPLSPPRAVPR